MIVRRSRLLFLLGWSSVLLTTIVARLVDIQLVNGQRYTAESDDNRYYTLRIPAHRGIFVDRYGEPLVWNKRVYSKRTNDSGSLHAITQAISQEEALQRMATEAAVVEFGLERQYRFPEATSHVLGYVGAVNADDLLQDRSLAVSDLIGKAGLERQFDQQLRGQSGQEVYEINAMGQRQRLVEKRAGVAGQTLATSIDPYLSEVAWQALGEETGVIIIQDAVTGEILTMVSKPGFNANLLSVSSLDPILEQQRQTQLKQLFNNERKPFFNRAIAGVYPPGSVFKLVTALGGLESKAIDASTSVLDEGVLKVGEYEYANWYYTQYGRTEGQISLRRAIARSNDIYFYKVAELLGANRLAEHARLMGYGQPTGVELGSEVAGTVPDPAWKEKVIGEPWFLGNTFHMGIGQGDVLVTPLQVSQMTQAIANHGTLCQPSLLKNTDQGKCRGVGFSDEHLDQVLTGMTDVCSIGGTAYPFFPYNAKFVSEASTSASVNQLIERGAMACKTGTAEFGGADEKGYRRTHAWFTAVLGTRPIVEIAQNVGENDTSIIEATASSDASFSASLASSTVNGEISQNEWFKRVRVNNFPSKLVIVVMVESSEVEPFKEGSQHAAPIAKKIVDWMHGADQNPPAPIAD